MKPPPSPEPVAPLTIGWREYVGFPGWNLRGVRAKSDTGARSSAIDVANVEEIGPDRVRFQVTVSRVGRRRFKTVEAEVARRTKVRSSFGHARDRLLIRVPVQIGPVVKEIEMGLVSRKRMLCRVLLGRTALRDDFLVDSSRAYLFGKAKRTKKAIKLKKVHKKMVAEGKIPGHPKPGAKALKGEVKGGAA